MLGIYIHVPFCASKCPYCDFYSIPLPTDAILNAYTDEVCRRLNAFSPLPPSDTLYFGGGTPSLLGGKRLATIIRAARQNGLTDNAEITLEANPADRLYDTFAAFTVEGGNRVSMGMQSATEQGLRALGRRHTLAQLESAVTDAHRAGIDNLSLDIMLATPSQTLMDIDQAVALCDAHQASHVSAYLLKIEPDTPFGRQPPSVPDDDTTADYYLYACDALERRGYRQYEISNFAKDGKQSRHNLKYWQLDPYLGIGPAAHSFFNGRRFWYPRSLDAFLKGIEPTEEQDRNMCTNSEDEFAMLRLRLTEGLTEAAFFAKYQRPLPTRWIAAANRLPRSLVTADSQQIALTRDGFLISNELITRILWGE